MISGTGLRNVIFTSSDFEDNFRFILNNQEIILNRFYADFISPTVSHIHQADPTINHLYLNDTIRELNISNEIINSELLNNIKQIASGYSIEIDEEMGHKIRLFSLLLGNDEMFNQMNELFPISTKEETDIDSCLQNLRFSNIGQNQALLDFISSYFYLIDQSKIENMPKSIIYSIISNKHLKISDEDSLFELIDRIIENDDQGNDENFDDGKIIFYEQIAIEKLNEENFQKLIDSIDSNQMTQFLWDKLKKCFYYQFLKNKNNEYDDRYSESAQIKTIEYDNNSNNRFKGIISYLGKGNPKSVVDNQIVDVTSSSILYNSLAHDPKHVADFYSEGSGSSFLSENIPNSWLLYDFKDKKVKPSSYSIKSHHFGGRGSYHPQTWVIEGSNDKNDWKILDSRNEDNSLNSRSVSHNFKIQNKLGKNDYYRYLRIKQTGVTVRNDNYFGFSSLEYFGSIIEQ